MLAGLSSIVPKNVRSDLKQGVSEYKNVLMYNEPHNALGSRYLPQLAVNYDRENVKYQYLLKSLLEKYGDKIVSLFEMMGYFSNHNKGG